MRLATFGFAALFLIVGSSVGCTAEGFHAFSEFNAGAVDFLETLRAGTELVRDWGG